VGEFITCNKNSCKGDVKEIKATTWETVDEWKTINLIEEGR